MIAQECINLAHEMATGKWKQLAPGTSKYERLLAIVNISQAMWESEPDTTWESRREDVSVSTVALNKKEYELPEEIRSVDTRQHARIVKGDMEWQLPFISAREAQNGKQGVDVRGNRVYLSGITESMAGGRLIIPSIMRLERIETPQDEILVDDPYWVVYMAAAEFARTSKTQQYQYGSIIALAQNAMEGMKSRNMANGKMTEVEREDIW